MKNLYNIISNDKELLSIYNKIEEYELEDKRYAYHNLEHIKNVTNTVEKNIGTIKI